MARVAEVRHTSGEGWYFVVRGGPFGDEVSDFYGWRASAVRGAKTLDVGLVRVYSRSGRLVKTIGG